jgi:plasmid stabilization system protein ParE
LGDAGLPPLESSMRLEWSGDALADLDRFAAFLEDRHPSLAKVVAEEIIKKV